MFHTRTTEKVDINRRPSVINLRGVVSRPDRLSLHPSVRPPDVLKEGKEEPVLVLSSSTL